MMTSSEIPYRAAHVTASATSNATRTTSSTTFDETLRSVAAWVQFNFARRALLLALANAADSHTTADACRNLFVAGCLIRI